MKLLIPQSIWIPLVGDSGPRLWARLAKGAGHKYIRRVPKPGGKGYRYYYKVSGGAGGLGHKDEFQAGAKFQLEHEGTKGHFEVLWSRGGKVRVKHDESGHEITMDSSAFAKVLRDHHAEKVTAHASRLKREHVQAKKTGTTKQQDRIKREAERHGVELETPVTLEQRGQLARELKFAFQSGGREELRSAHDRAVAAGVPVPFMIARAAKSSLREPLTKEERKTMEVERKARFDFPRATAAQLKTAGFERNQQAMQNFAPGEGYVQRTRLGRMRYYSDAEAHRRARKATKSVSWYVPISQGVTK